MSRELENKHNGTILSPVVSSLQPDLRHFVQCTDRHAMCIDLVGLGGFEYNTVILEYW